MGETGSSARWRTYDGEVSEQTGVATERPRRRRWVRRALVAFLAVIVLLSGALWYLQHRLVSQVDQIPDALPTAEGRPDPSAGKALNVLLLGSDKRADGSVAGERSDTMMLVNIASDRSSMSVISIPRDSWVDVPGHGTNKINAAFSFGGTALAVQTVEKLTDVRIDHVAVIDWEGFKQLTDSLGGVEVTVSQDSYDSMNKKKWTKGTHRLDGDEALLYVRQRYGLPGGDFDRVKRQQNFLRALMNQTLDTWGGGNPATIYRGLDAVTSQLSVDDTWSTSDLRGLAWSLRSIRGKDVKFTTVPIAGTGMEGAASVVYIDNTQADDLWAAIRADRAARWITSNKVATPDDVR